jgi:putative aminopeptidase FrvX
MIRVSGTAGGCQNPPPVAKPVFSRLEAAGERGTFPSMRTKAVSLLHELTEAHAVPGHEDEVRAIFVDELEDCGDLSTDRNGSVFCEMGNGPRVMVAGHMDEVGFLVQNITHEGFIQFVPVGGWWEHNLLSQRVEIRTRGGAKILGVIASRPPHFLPENQRRQVMQIEQMCIDVGAESRKQAVEEYGISLGDPIAPVAAFTPMAREDLFMAKAFDNRVGMAGVIQAGQILAGSALPNRLILCGTVQEEVGLRGAKSAAAFAMPDVAIVLEGPPADDAPGFSRADCQGRLGGGVQIRMFDPSAISNPRLAKLAIDVARAERIPHQVTVRRSGGTDAGSFHLANHGIPCIVLGVPARYIHSHNAIIDVNDYLHMVSLVVALVRRLDEATVDGLVSYL